MATQTNLETSPQLTTPMNFVTLGVYGCTEVAFFNALQQAGVDTFCDIRWRRGVRGSEYAFVNSARLQKRLAELGIRYLHLRELAPAPDLRQRQFDADKAARITKRKRIVLSEAFIEAYRTTHLTTFDSRKFIEQLGAEARTVALFCVEREPAACHRSLLAERLRQDLGVQVVNLIPGQPVP
jgi:uncharacterized protein (DUF488 family)